MSYKAVIVCLLTLFWGQTSLAQNLGDPDCDVLWLVSSYSTNAIKVFDGCSGEYIQDMEDNDWLGGPQAIVEEGNGDLLVISEENDRLIRFDRETLTAKEVVVGDDPDTAQVEPSFFDAPTGLAVSADGRVFVGSFSQDRVVEIDPVTGNFVQTLIDSGQALKASMPACGSRGISFTYPASTRATSFPSTEPVTQPPGVCFSRE